MFTFPQVVAMFIKSYCTHNMDFVVYGRFGTSFDMNNPTTFQYKAILLKYENRCMG